MKEGREKIHVGGKGRMRDGVWRDGVWREECGGMECGEMECGEMEYIHVCLRE